MHRIVIFVTTCLLLVLILPRSAAQPAAPLIGDGHLRAQRLGITHISSVDTPRSDERYERALALGAGWNRWPLYWDRVETRVGDYDWAAYDDLVQDDLRAGLSLNVILLGIPEIHRAGESIGGLMQPIFSDGTDIPEPGKTINPRNPWARFVRQAVERYRPGGTLAQESGWPAGVGIRVWEIWNEPDFEFFWSAGVASYARLLKVAYLVIDTVDPDAVVMVGGLLYPTHENWLAQILALYQDEPAPEDYGWYMDAVAIHNYGDAWRSGWLTLVARQTMVEYGIQRPIWLTETGVPIWDDYPGPTWTEDAPDSRELLATAEQQAAFLVQSAAYAWAEGAQVIIYHQLYDDCGNQPPGTDFAPAADGLCQPGEICAGDVFGIFRNPSTAICFSRHPRPDSPRPVAEAYALLAQVFGGAGFSRRGIIDDVRDDDVVVITFTRPQSHERIVVVWNTRQEPLDLALPAFGSDATLYAEGTANLIFPEDGNYTLTLAAATMPRQRFLDPRLSVDIGGAPVILVEQVTESDAWAQLEFITFESTEQPVIVTTPDARPSMTDAQAAELMAASPTGVVFYSQDNARLRSAPDTEGTQVITTLRPRIAVSVIGRLPDNSWFQVDFEGQSVWVAAFLGEIYGDLNTVPIIDLATPEAESS